MKHNYKLIAGLISAVALAASSMVYAQPGGMGAGLGGGMGPGMGGGMGFAMGGNADTATVAARLTALKTELKITSEQETAWSAFADVVTQHNSAMQALRSQMQTQMRNAQGADVAAQRSAMLAQRDANQASHRAAFDALYATLTPAQKTVADQQFGRMAGPRGGFGGRGCRTL